jgi:hypothetical protein
MYCNTLRHLLSFLWLQLTGGHAALIGKVRRVAARKAQAR